MPGMIAGRAVFEEPSAPTGPVALHPIAVLTFEQLAELWGPQKRSDAIRRVFGCSPTRYVQFLNRKVLDDETAGAVAPTVFERLVARRDERRDLRFGVSA